MQSSNPHTSIFWWSEVRFPASINSVIYILFEFSILCLTLLSFIVIHLLICSYKYLAFQLLIAHQQTQDLQQLLTSIFYLLTGVKDHGLFIELNLSGMDCE